MQLGITDYQGVTRWRWVLQDDAGNFLADHEVNLDIDAQEYQGYDDPPKYPKRGVYPGRGNRVHRPGSRTPRRLR